MIKLIKKIFIGAIILIVVIAGGLLLKSNAPNIMGYFVEKKETTYSSMIVLEKVQSINELSTIDYMYNAIASVPDEDKKNDKYYIKYKGEVTAGIDLEKMTEKSIIIDDENKTLTVLLPEVEIQDVEVNPESLEFIFTKEKYDTEGIFDEAYNACKNNLKEQIKNDMELHEMARGNAETAVMALLSPLVKEYKIIID